jgi:hypothetical protein
MYNRASMTIGVCALSLILFGVIAVVLDPPPRHGHLGAQVETRPILPAK